ncbi:hypothetical protein scyTo_0024671, partial [Scyliorhinus torazame]|nr:hypothetical protein [Scyliorhinus torazame]
KSNFHRSQTFSYKNGIALPVVPKVGIGGEPLHVNQLSVSDVDELANKRPTLTYGQAKQTPPADFIPGHVAFDKKVLKFDGYFKETVHESPQEYYRVRPIVLYYYLEDDSIAIHEPEVDNAGLPQGKLINRQRLPKNDQGDCWHWKDLNVAMDLVAYGKRYRLTCCDKFTCVGSSSANVTSPALSLVKGCLCNIFIGISKAHVCCRQGEISQCSCS